MPSASSPAGIGSLLPTVSGGILLIVLQRFVRGLLLSGILLRRLRAAGRYLRGSNHSSPKHSGSHSYKYYARPHHCPLSVLRQTQATSAIRRRCRLHSCGKMIRLYGKPWRCQPLAARNGERSDPTARALDHRMASFDRVASSHAGPSRLGVSRLSAHPPLTNF